MNIMNHVGISRSLGLVLVLGLAAASQSSCGVGSEHRFRSSECGFTVAFPAEPTPDFRPAHSQSSPQGTVGVEAIYSYRLEQSGVVYVAACLDRPKPHSLQSLMQGAEAMGRLHGEVLSTRAVTLDGYTGFETKVSLRGTGDVKLERWFLRGNRQYQVAVIWPKNVPASGPFASFVESFRFAK
jgi:hypothetical protein